MKTSERVMLWLTLWAATGFGMFRLFQAVGDSQRLDFWDMSKYAVSGLRLRQSLLDLDLWQAVVELHSMSVWPPFWPSSLALAFSLAGLEPWVPRALMILSWGAVPLVAAWALNPLRKGWTVALMVAGWWISGPFFQGMASVNMLEIPGLLLQILALGAYLRAVPALAGQSAPTSTAVSRGRYWKLLSIFSLCLIFCKYNYGLLWLVPLGLAELRRRAGSWRQGADSTLLALRSVPWRHPLTLLMTAIGFLLVVVRLTGGIDTEWLGLQLRMTSIGNPAYVLYLLLWGAGLWRQRVDPAGLRQLWLRLPPEHRTFSRWCLLPTAIWLLLPPHMKELFGFLENRDSGLTLWQSLAFYPRVWIQDFAVTPELGIVVLILATFSLGYLGSRNPHRRIIALNCWIAVVALLSHPYKVDRFGFQAAWWLGLCAAMVCSELPVVAPRALRSPFVLRWSMALLPLLAAGSVDREQVRGFHHHWTVDSELRPLLNQLALPENRNQGLVVLGTWNGLSPALVEWICRAQDQALQVSHVPLPSSDFALARRRSGRLSRALEDTRFRRLAILEAAPQHPNPEAYSQETLWLQPVKNGLLAGGEFQPAPESPVSAAGYTLTWWTRVDPASGFP